MIELIYCANGNPRFAEIAISHGFKYGAQLPGKTYYPIYFADQDWKKPDRERYMKEVQKHSPAIATVLDLEEDSQLDDVLSWAEEISSHVTEAIIIIPKSFGIINMLPSRIGGKDIRLGYSVPTKYGGTEVPLWEFGEWPVHLLGGSPQRQMELSHYLNVVSIDGNYAQMMAVRFCEVWVDGKWMEYEDVSGDRMESDVPYASFDMSCENIMNAWTNIQ